MYNISELSIESILIIKATRLNSLKFQNDEDHLPCKTRAQSCQCEAQRSSNYGIDDTASNQCQESRPLKCIGAFHLTATANDRGAHLYLFHVGEVVDDVSENLH